jgi:hypothetical protein
MGSSKREPKNDDRTYDRSRLTTIKHEMPANRLGEGIHKSGDDLLSRYSHSHRPQVLDEAFAKEMDLRSLISEK